MMDSDKNSIPEAIEDFSFPITLAFADNHIAYFSERITGRLWKIEGQNYTLIRTFPIVPLIGHHETGLLGITLDPDFNSNHYIYCFYTYGTNEHDMKNRVVRVKDSGGDEEVIFGNLPAGRIHNGGILTFGPDNCLYVGIGVQNEIMDKAQDVSWLGGKILKVNNDGTIPSDNPFPDSPVYSFGHRNIFGLAFHPKTKKLYTCDVGPDKNDEINIIEKGGNYGWPNVMGESDDPHYVNPLISYTPVITPTQCTFVDNDFYFGSYNEGSVHKLTLEGENLDKVKKDEIVYQGKQFGVIGVFFSPDHKYYVTLPNQIQAFTPKVIREVKY